MNEPTAKNKALVVCATHGLTYNSELDAGCVLCRKLKEQPVSYGYSRLLRRLPLMFALSLLAVAVFMVLRAGRHVGTYAGEAQGRMLTPKEPPGQPQPPPPRAFVPQAAVPRQRPADPVETYSMGDPKHANIKSMYDAAEVGSGLAIKRMLAEGANINEVDGPYKKLGYTPLRVAIENQHSWLALWLIREGANVGSGGLVLTATEKHMPMVLDALLEKGLDPNTPSGDAYKFRDRSIHFAVDNADVETADVLARHGATLDDTDNFGLTLLTRAARSRNENSVHMVQWLIDHGADPGKVDKQRDQYNFREEPGFTPVRQAAIRGNNDVLRLLALNGASVNLTRYDGFRSQPLLAEAAMTRDTKGREIAQRDVIHTLIELGADPRPAVSYMTACQRCNDYRPWAEEAFIRKAAEHPEFVSMYNVVDEGGNTHLHWAAMLGEATLVKRLLERDLDIDRLGRGPGKFTGKYAAGGTPLHLAAAYGRFKAVDVLLAAGAKREQVDTQGRTANDVACKHFLYNYQSDEAESCERLHATLSGNAAATAP